VRKADDTILHEAFNVAKIKAKTLIIHLNNEKFVQKMHAERCRILRSLGMRPDINVTNAKNAATESRTKHR